MGTTLATENGLLHRASAFTWKGLQKGFHAVFNMNRFHGNTKTMLQANNMLEAATEGKFPWGRDALDYANVVLKYVSDYVDIYYPSDESVRNDAELVAFWHGLAMVEGSQIPALQGKRTLKGVIAHFIAYVTGFHNHAGNVADYLVDPTFASPKIRPNKEIADIQATIQGINIGLMT